ncbi:MAG: hypothetical protein ACFB12_26640 [Leptolyngbyaceae cyanobacterium]
MSITLNADLPTVGFNDLLINVEPEAQEQRLVMIAPPTVAIKDPLVGGGLRQLS